MKSIIAAIACSLVVFGLITWGALEWSGVAILRTQRPGGGVRDTHVWCAAEGGGIWIEAATQGRAFLSDIRRRPQVSLSTDGEFAPYRAEILDTPSAHDRIRELLRVKYGWRDWWVGLLQDTSASVVVHLRPIR